MSSQTGPVSGSLRERLAKLPKEERHRTLLNLVRSQAAVILGETMPDRIDSACSFGELGFDSSLTVQLQNCLQERLKVNLLTTPLFDQPIPSVLASHLNWQLHACRSH
jgi:hypothetical protein